MARRILMMGKDVKYINVHGKGVQSQDRDILMIGDNAEFIEVTVGEHSEECAIDKNKFEFYVRLSDHTESTLANTIDDDMSEEQVRRECKNILGTWQGDCPVGVDVYRNGEYFTSEDVED